MKAFWSWQSDTPGKTGRHLVRQALREAIEELKDLDEVEDSPRDDEHQDLHLDHDREGVAGSPDLAQVILKKIDVAFLFIADVTIVGQVSTGDSTKPPKKLINSNVAIELGYALKALGNPGLLMVMNHHYGTREDLPFDLRGKAGPIVFTLNPDADKETITTERNKLKGDLKHAISLCLAEHKKALAASKQVQPVIKQVTSADWESIGEKLRQNCQFLRVDSQRNGNWKSERWSITGGPHNPLCNALVGKAGAMLLSSPNVRAGLPQSVLSEADNLTRWFLYLKHKGYHSVGHWFEETLDDGEKRLGLLGSIPNLVQASLAVCVECSTAEM